MNILDLPAKVFSSCDKNFIGTAVCRLCACFLVKGIILCRGEIIDFNCSDLICKYSSVSFVHGNILYVRKTVRFSCCAICATCTDGPNRNLLNRLCNPQ